MKKFALITGASGGIGKAVAKMLAEEGWNLYLHYHQNQEAVKELLDICAARGVEAIPICADLAVDGGVQTIVDNIFHLDAIVYASGTSQYGLLTDMEENAIDEQYRIHVKSPLLLSKLLLPKLMQNETSHIILVSSIWGQTGAACESVYSAMKGAQIAFAKALAKETARSGVRVNAVAPGAVDTNMLRLFSEEEIAGVEEEIPLGRLAKPAEIAQTISFLLSDKAAYITGQTIAVNGGWYI
ncbi:putative oxidoreductase YmfI [Weizmannia acidilactici]|uniref:Oxidoreductase YmfI n=1 Tax=Weizmannia acidilactici TaxID=2607726 RepID=A0A5J4JEV6_9BACI|nr:SDR family oxidoreductase [Weizmannia acidilactici]GER68980.1 putative oxidoreductase YmfI [Weizmannia acidilactici]GER72047.1 putative oxidoreductase YmfI [Weizmannia acidilactici]